MQCLLALCYRSGVGVLKDKKKATKLEQKASDLGESNAMTRLKKHELWQRVTKRRK